MHDREVVAAIVAGDPAGLAEAYDRYATPLYSFCRTMLREPADAADAVQDTFVIAAPRMAGLRDPERLRSWLYAVARNECHRRLRAGSQHASIEEAPDVTDEAVDVAADVERADLRALVRDALGGVGPTEREILELQLRQGLSGAEVASVLGISRNHAHALLSRARDHLETSLGALVVARTGRQDCPELDAMLRDWDGALTVLIRKRLNRHVERCDVCSDGGAGRYRRPCSSGSLRSRRCRCWRGACRPASVIRSCGSPPGTPPPPWLIGPRWRRPRTRSAIMVFPAPFISPARPGCTRGQPMPARWPAPPPPSRRALP
jgi:RNA polymerase sigma factor (sigma-70 family)